MRSENQVNFIEKILKLYNFFNPSIVPIKIKDRRQIWIVGLISQSKWVKWWLYVRILEKESMHMDTGYLFYSTPSGVRIKRVYW